MKLSIKPAIFLSGMSGNKCWGLGGTCHGKTTKGENRQVKELTASLL